MRTGYIVDHSCGRRYVGGIFDEGDGWAVVYRAGIPELLWDADVEDAPVASRHRDCDLTVEAAL